MVEFEEFMFALSITSRGTVEEKLNWAFNLYDIDHDNTITKAEFTTVVTGSVSLIKCKNNHFRQQSSKCSGKTK